MRDKHRLLGSVAMPSLGRAPDVVPRSTDRMFRTAFRNIPDAVVTSAGLLFSCRGLHEQQPEGSTRYKQPGPRGESEAPAAFSLFPSDDALERRATTLWRRRLGN